MFAINKKFKAAQRHENTKEKIELLLSVLEDCRAGLSKGKQDEFHSALETIQQKAVRILKILKVPHTPPQRVSTSAHNLHTSLTSRSMNQISPIKKSQSSHSLTHLNLETSPVRALDDLFLSNSQGYPGYRLGDKTPEHISKHFSKQSLLSSSGGGYSFVFEPENDSK